MRTDGRSGSLQEHLRQSRENALNTMGTKERSTGLQATFQKIAVSGLSRSRSNSSSAGSIPQEFLKNGAKEASISTVHKARGPRGEECFLQGGSVIPVFEGRKSTSTVIRSSSREYDADGEATELSQPPETKDSGCQTRESLFSTQAFDVTAAERTSSPARRQYPPFSTFGYTGDPADGKRYKAEAVIEVDGRKEERGPAVDARPFSIDSTKSAPDVIVTH